MSLHIAAKVDILKLIYGHFKPTSGSVEKAAEKKYLNFDPLVPKESYGMTVEEYLGKQVPGGAKAGASFLHEVSDGEGERGEPLE